MLTYDMIKESTISEHTYAQMASLLKHNQTIFDCSEIELNELLLDLIVDKLNDRVKIEAQHIERLEELNFKYPSSALTESLNNCNARMQAIKDIRNMIYEL